jgi:hypothetical protein
MEMSASILIFFALSPLFGIFLGTFASHLNGISLASFFPNIIGVALGAPLIFLAQKNFGMVSKYIFFITVVILILLGMSFLSPGDQGVHRWISIGSLHFNVAMACTPFLLYSIHYYFDRNQAFAFTLMALISVIFILAPDAGEAISFAGGALTILILKKSLGKMVRVLGAGALSLAAVLAYLRPDPLLAVAQVERILHLIVETGFLGVLAVILSILCLFAPLLFAQLKLIKNRERAIIFTVYFILNFAVTEIGNFPVPVIGAGMGPVLGWYLLVALVLMPPDHQYQTLYQVGIGVPSSD